MSSYPSHQSQVLLLDADDTLWENNVYFERVKRQFLALASPDPSTWPAANECINREERRVIAECGYGLKCFAVAIRRAFQALAPERWNEETEAALTELTLGIEHEPVELLPDAAETVEYLAGRHRLWLLTKGDYAEQTRKLRLSGLASRFEQVRVLAEKNVQAYRQILAELRRPPRECWMIGNSPKSDINPALAAGLNAVFIPHPLTWVLERCDVANPSGCECLQVKRIADLRDHF